MDEEKMNAFEPNVVQSEETDSAETGEAASPRDIESMSDDDFATYLEKVQSGTLPPSDEVTEDEEEADDTGDTDPQQSEAKETKPYKVYNTHEEFQQDFDRAMGERLKKNREDMDMLTKLKIQARNFYGDSADDNAALMALLGDLTTQNADKRGIETEEYNRQTEDAEDARRWREQEARAAGAQKQKNAQKERLMSDIEDVRRVVPSFDFQKAMQNETFRNAIMSGASVQTAYMMCNQPKARKPKRQSVNQVAMQAGVSGQSDYDPSKLSDADFNAYIERLKNS